MNILVDLRPLQSGKISGVEVFIENVVRNILEINKGHKIILWTNSSCNFPNNFPEFTDKKNLSISIHTSKSNRILNLLCSIFRYPKIDKLVTRELKKRGLFKNNEKIDCVFLPDLRPAPVSKNTKKIIVVHDLSFIHFPQTFSRKSRIWYKILRVKKELNEADKIITPSNFTKKDIVKTLKVKPEKISVVYEGVEDRFLPAEESEIYNLRKKLNLPQKFLLSLCTIEPRKNLHTLISAFHWFYKRFPKSDLYIVIAGEKDTKIFADPNLEHLKNVIFTGFIPENQKATLYSAATAFAFPSLFEGFGLPVLEAMACGTPVIASQFSSIPEITGEAAILFNPTDKTEISNAIEMVCLNKNLRDKLAKKGLEQARKFKWNKTAKEIFNILQSC